MAVSDLPPRLQERVVCSISASAQYEIPANLMLAVAEQEAGRPGQWVRNTNGTSDVGALQFNTAYLTTLARYGITANDVAQAGCYPYQLAAWRLRQHLRHDTGDMWTRAANYHSRTPVYNASYRAQLVVRASRWADWLQARYPTYDMTKPAVAVRLARDATKQADTQSKAVSVAISAQSVPQARGLQKIETSGYVPRTMKVFESGQP